MKKLKAMLTTLSILLALSVVVPVQTVRADPSGGPQGTSDSQRRSTAEQQAKAAALWALIMALLGW
jgi:hypothetical protein